MLSGEKILCIGAHPDDIELNCSGLLLSLPFKSINVTATLGEKVTMLNGKSTEGISERFIKSVREKEFLNAGNILDAETFILELKDGNINKRILRAKIEKILKKENIMMIITHHWESFHNDHKSVGECIKEIGPSVPVLYWIDYSCPSVKPTISLNIKKFWKSKCDILSSYHSQITFREFRRIFSGDKSSKKEKFFVLEKDFPEIRFLKKYIRFSKLKH